MVWAGRVLVVGVVLGFGVQTIFVHSCELATSTLDGHNILVRTPICAFLESMKSSLSLEFNHMPVNDILCSQF